MLRAVLRNWFSFSANSLTKKKFSKVDLDDARDKQSTDHKFLVNKRMLGFIFWYLNNKMQRFLAYECHITVVTAVFSCLYM